MNLYYNLMDYYKYWLNQMSYYLQLLFYLIYL